MKLAIFLNIRFYFDGECYTADERYYQFWTSLTRYFEKVVLCVPVVSDQTLKGLFNVDLKGGRVEICHSPPSGMFGLHRLPKIHQIISNNIHQWDIVGAVVPNLVGLFLLHRARRFSRPRFGYIRGNVKQTAWFGLKGWKKCIGYTMFSVLDVVTKRFARTNLTFVVGHDLLGKYREADNAVFQIVVSLISDKQVNVETTSSEATATLRVLYVGRLSGEKGIFTLVQGLALFQKTYHIDFVLRIAGSGPEEGRLKDYAKTLGIGEAVHFLGFVKDDRALDDLYKDSDVFILPSYTEGVPKVILEAMACGIPIISTSVGGIPEIIRNGHNGLLIPPGDSRAICDSIKRVWTDSQLRSKLQKNGYETVKKYTMESQGANIVSVLERHYDLQLVERN